MIFILAIIKLTSDRLSTPIFSKTSVNDSTSLVLATGSIPLLMISCIQSQALSLNSGIDMNRMITGTNLSFAIRPMSIHEIYLPTTSRHIQTISDWLVLYSFCQQYKCIFHNNIKFILLQIHKHIRVRSCFWKCITVWSNLLIISCSFQQISVMKSVGCFLAIFSWRLLSPIPNYPSISWGSNSHKRLLD